MIMGEWEEAQALTRAERLARLEESVHGVRREYGILREAVTMQANRMDLVTRRVQENCTLTNSLHAQCIADQDIREWVRAQKAEAATKSKLDEERAAYRRDAMKLASTIMTLIAGVLYLLGAFNLDRLKGFASIVSGLGK